MGLSQALVIQDDEVVQERAETVFVSSVALGFIAAAIIAASGPLAASFFSQPDLTAIVPILGLNLALRSFGSTHYAIAQRGMDFRTRTIAEVSEVSARGLIGIGLALAGFGAWSLVIGYLGGTVVRVVALWLMVSWRPQFRARLSDLNSMIRFGGTLSGVNIVAALIANIDYLFIGRALGATSLGLYTLGFRLPDLLIVNLAAVASQVLFPAFSAVGRDSLGPAYLVAFRYTLMVAMPVALTLAILAEPIVLALFGSQWTESIAPMQVITIYSLAEAVGIPAGIAYKATGRAGVLLYLGIARLVLLTILLYFFVDLGITAVAASQAALAGLASVAGIFLAARLLGVTLPQILGSAWPALAASVVMAVPLLATERLIDVPWLAVLVGGLAGSLAYVAFLLIAAPSTIEFLRGKMFPASPEPPEDLTKVRETDVIS